MHFAPFWLTPRRSIVIEISAPDNTVNLNSLAGTTVDGPFILLHLNGNDITSTDTDTPAIRGNTLNEFSDLMIDFDGAIVSAKGGDGGAGGAEDHDPLQFFPGQPGTAGGDAITVNCNTLGVGPGTVHGGFGGGGGGGSEGLNNGSGGGGGAPNGSGGAPGLGNNPDPDPGDDATSDTRGLGGTTGLNGGNGGDGTHVATAGEDGTEANGGAAGADGKAVELNTDGAWATSGGLTVIGDVS